MGGSRRDTQIGVPVQRVVDIAPAARLAGPLIASAEFDFDLGSDVGCVLKRVWIGEQQRHFLSSFRGRLKLPSGLPHDGFKSLRQLRENLVRDFGLNRLSELFIELPPLRIGDSFIRQITLARKSQGCAIQRDIDVLRETMN